MIDILTLKGLDALPHVEDLARLRITVFREFPYLYEGSMDYEKSYLAGYFATPQSILVLARDRENRVVGASTAMPLATASAEFREPLAAAGFDVARVHYFGESVLLPEFRGRGIGHRFFDAREAAARDAGCDVTAFCAVVRPADHPQRPPGHRPHDAFWAKRGYTHHPDITVTLGWREPGDTAESPHSLSYWIRHAAPIRHPALASGQPDV